MGNIHALIDRVVHPERRQVARPARSGFASAVRSGLAASLYRNQQLAASFAEGYARLHHGGPGPEQASRDEAEALAVDALGRLLNPSRKDDETP